MIQAYEGLVRVTGLALQIGRVHQDLNIEFCADPHTSTISFTFNKKKYVIRVETRVLEKLASFVRRMAWDAMRARRIITTP